jgi:hypothetical protein
MTKPFFATIVADRQGHLFGKLRELLPAVLARFQGVTVLATTTTDERVLTLLESVRASIDTGEPDGNAIGRHRRQAIGLALENGVAEHILYADIDHLLRWIENDAIELDLVLQRMRDWDCTVIGRGSRSFAALPRRLLQTETIVNHIYALITGRNWDLMMAARGLSRRAAQAIVDHCAVDTIGNDAAWPLFCEERGFSVGYVEAEGLTYQTNADYSHDLKDSLDQDPRAWAQRVELAWQHVEAMLPYMKHR